MASCAKFSVISSQKFCGAVCRAGSYKYNFSNLHPCFSKADNGTAGGRLKKEELQGMSVSDLFIMLGGLAVFLFGMNVMGNALERQADSRLRNILTHLTENPLLGS